MSADWTPTPEEWEERQKLMEQFRHDGPAPHEPRRILKSEDRAHIFRLIDREVKRAIERQHASNNFLETLGALVSKIQTKSDNKP